MTGAALLREKKLERLLIATLAPVRGLSTEPIPSLVEPNGWRKWWRAYYALRKKDEA